MKNKNVIKWLGLTAAVIIAGVLVYKQFSKTKDKTSEILKNIEAQLHKINTERDTVIETKGGIVFAIPANAFNTDSKEINVTIQEAITAADIIKAGFSTTSNGELLQTEGMFNIQATDGNKELKLNKAIEVNFPTQKLNDKVMLFDSEVDKEGNINWINPKKLNNDLKTVDIQSLDFYPKDYLPTLQALGFDDKNKKFTDSLYYSFSGYCNKILKQSDKNKIMEIKEEIYEDNELKVTQLVYRDSSESTKYVPIQTTINNCEIDPARIKAIWNKKFNQTILATKEFEERLKFIFTTCNPNYLQNYISNLQLPLYVIDSMCAANASGSEKDKFLEFYNRKNGGVPVSSNLQRKLSKYFENKYTAHKQATEKTWEKYYAEIDALNSKAYEKRTTKQMQDFKRESSNFQEEFCINFIDAYRQLGEKAVCPAPLIAPYYYHFDINNVGWKNLDAYVFEATAKRESLEYHTDDGRKAVITYLPMSVKVENKKAYDRLMVYIIPNNLSSYQRVSDKGEKFEENLNTLLKYDLLVLGYKGKESFVYTQKNIAAKSFTVSLSKIDNKDLDTMLNQFSSIKKEDLLTDFEYQLFEQKESVRQIKLAKEADLRRQIAKSIFNCPYEIMETAPKAPRKVK